MLAVLDLVTQVAPSRSTVLISRRKRHGKEVIAKAIHAASTRADKAFIPINTGSIPVDLLESQLFGHVKGAFTSAVASKKGLFEVADQGTIFFDEISHRPRDPGQAPARDSGARVHAPRRHRNHQGGRPHPRRLQRRPAQNRARGPFPRGFVSPAQRDLDSLAAAARPQGRYPAARRPLPRAVLPGKYQAAARISPTPR